MANTIYSTFIYWIPVNHILSMMIFQFHVLKLLALDKMYYWVQQNVLIGYCITMSWNIFNESNTITYEGEMKKHSFISMART